MTVTFCFSFGVFNQIGFLTLVDQIGNSRIDGSDPGLNVFDENQLFCSVLFE